MARVDQWPSRLNYTNYTIFRVIPKAKGYTHRFSAVWCGVCLYPYRTIPVHPGYTTSSPAVSRVHVCTCGESKEAVGLGIRAIRGVMASINNLSVNLPGFIVYVEPALT